jgi:trimeric autotransporter adhesin
VSFSGTGITVNSTSFVSSTQLTANITISAGAATGARNVTVTNPDAGTGTCSGCFTVNTGPTVTSVSPSSVAHSSTQNVTVNGTNFASGATVSFSGGVTVNSVTFVDSSHLTVNVTTGGNSQKGTYNVTVTNPDAGTGTCTNCFTVT